VKERLRALMRSMRRWQIVLLAATAAAVWVVAFVGWPRSGAGDATFVTLLVSLGMVAPMIVTAANLHRTERWRDVTARRLEAVEAATDSPEGSLRGLNERVRLLDGVVADFSRRPWDPTTLPWPAPEADPKPVLLLPGAAYHLPEIMALADALHARGIPSRISVGDAHWPRIATGLAWYERPVFKLPDPARIDEVAAVVTMKDWAGYGVLVEAANACGIPTFAKVEGAQDFEDIDTPYRREAYRTARHILCQGANDYAALEGDRHIVGSTRLERLWLAPAEPIVDDTAVINVNFTYGVMTEERKAWLDTAIAGCEAAGAPYVLAMHPAEKRQRFHPRATTVPIARLLLRAGVLISRFSTVPFEAMARGVPFIYHNPHGECVPLFADSKGAFTTSVAVDSLAMAIEEARGWRDDYRSRAAEFFTAQVDIDPARDSATRGALVIERFL